MSKTPKLAWLSILVECHAAPNLRIREGRANPECIPTPERVHSLYADGYCAICEAGLIAYTTQPEEDIRDRGISAGFDAYCQKGGPPEALIWLIQALMR